MYGQTPLHHTVAADAVDITRFLVESGADIQIADDDGDNPLKFAMAIQIERNRNLKIVEYLSSLPNA